MRNRNHRKHNHCFQLFAEAKRKARARKEAKAAQKAKADAPHQSLRTMAELYDSPEEQAFCERFNVSGKLELYHIWHRFAEGLPEHLRQETFRRMILELRDMFGLKNSNSLCADEHYQNNDGHSAELHLHGHKNAAGDLIISVDELEIWRDHHLATLIEDVHCVWKIDAAVLYDFADNWLHHILDVIDEARDHHRLIQLYDTQGAREMARVRLTRMAEIANDDTNPSIKM